MLPLLKRFKIYHKETLHIGEKIDRNAKFLIELYVI
jgi:hypothetical protein